MSTPRDSPKSGANLRCLHRQAASAAKSRERILRLNRDAAFAAANRERFIRRRADPAFRALQLAAMKRLHADPEFAARRNAIFARLNADPEFRARCRAAVTTPPEKRAVIIAALKADPNALRLARTTGVASCYTIHKIAKEARIELPGTRKLTPEQKFQAIRRRDRGETLTAIAQSYKVDLSTISRLVKKLRLKRRDDRKLSSEQKRDAIRRLDRGEKIARIAQFYNVSPNTIRRLHRTRITSAPRAITGKSSGPVEAHSPSIAD